MPRKARIDSPRSPAVKGRLKMGHFGSWEIGHINLPSEAMKQLTVGVVISLIGIGLILSKISFWGILALIIGVAVGIKGRNKIDRS